MPGSEQVRYATWPGVSGTAAASPRRRCGTWIVVFFDPSEFTREHDERATRQLMTAWPEPPREAKNQAAVHIWYPTKFGGGPVRPFRSLAEAVATWPEYGLDDLFDGVWRRNPTRVSRESSNSGWPGTARPNAGPASES